MSDLELDCISDECAAHQLLAPEPATTHAVRLDVVTPDTVARATSSRGS
jgi:hypothetical protein